MYRCLDLLRPHKEGLFAHLRGRWSDLFGARYEVLLYDLTSTYFECDQPDGETDPRRFGYSRDRRGDCVQVVVALVVTPEGLPLAYEMFPGNTADKTTLRGMIYTIRTRYGAAKRIWVMDRGIPTEEILAGLRVKLLPFAGEVYVLAESRDRAGKERGMRRCRLKGYWKRLDELSGHKGMRDELVRKIGAAQQRAGRQAGQLVAVSVAADGTLTYSLQREKLRQVRQREGRYLLHTNLEATAPEVIWRCYMQLSHVEDLKGDQGLRPIYHQKATRIEAHLFVAFLAYCLAINLRQQLRALAPGLMPRVAWEKLATIQMLDVLVPTTDGRELLLVRPTEPGQDVELLLERLGWALPPQPPP